MSRRADAFFYGLFMDQDLLRAKGVLPEAAELAWLDGYALRIGRRTVLVPSACARSARRSACRLSTSLRCNDCSRRSRHCCS